MSDVECPYCGSEQEINHDDGYGYEESTRHEQECRDCEKEFTFTTSIMFLYDAEKAPCLNGEDHKLKPSNTAPKFYTKMCCEWCDFRRVPTEEERKEFDIPVNPNS